MLHSPNKVYDDRDKNGLKLEMFDANLINLSTKVGEIGVQLSSENGLNFVITRPQNCVKTRPKDQHEKQIEW